VGKTAHITKGIMKYCTWITLKTSKMDVSNNAKDGVIMHLPVLGRGWNMWC
jgi:hypothetical protein